MPFTRPIFAATAVLLLAVFAFQTFVLAAAPPSSRPNVLFLAIDDQNDWIGCLGGHPLAKTPHIDGLADRGTLFLNAHVQAPLCNPSRTSLMLGLRSTTTGIHGLAPWFRTVPQWSDRVTLPQHFKSHGYKTFTAGKIYHGGVGGPQLRAREFDVWGPAGGIGVKPEQKLIPPTPMGNHPLMDWGCFPHNDEDKGDYKVASWAVEQLRDMPQDQPFFLAAGFFLPHVPCYATQKWFDLYPDDDSVLPPIREDDRADTPRSSWYIHWNLPEPRLKWIRENNQWRNLVRSYLACTSFVDAQVGRILEALDQAGLADNTVVVLWGDHGYHLGEKAISGKNTLWERSTRVPLVFAGPGVGAGGADQPAGRAARYLSDAGRVVRTDRARRPGRLEPCAAIERPRRQTRAARDHQPQSRQPRDPQRTLALHSLRGRRGGIVRPAQRSARVDQPDRRSPARRRSRRASALAAPDRRPARSRQRASSADL